MIQLAWLIAAVALPALLALGGPLVLHPSSVFAQYAAAGQHGKGEHRRPEDIAEYLQHLDRAERDRDQKPVEVIDALDLKPGMAVADLGAGSGYFTRRLVQAVTDTGKVYAVDVEPAMLEYTKQSMARMGMPSSVEFILATRDNAKLRPRSVDLIFVCNVFHHLENRPSYFEGVTAALKPSGRVAIIDFYHDERSGDVGFPRHHLVPRETVINEMTKAGYVLLREHAFLPRQYFLEFAPQAH